MFKIIILSKEVNWQKKKRKEKTKKFGGGIKMWEQLKRGEESAQRRAEWKRNEKLIMKGAREKVSNETKRNETIEV